jgi:hypothetical protein
MAETSSSVAITGLASARQVMAESSSALTANISVARQAIQPTCRSGASTAARQNAPLSSSTK